MTSRQPPQKEKSGNEARQEVLDFIDKMTKSEDSTNRSNVFDSADFNSFLHQKLMVSKDSVNTTLGAGDFSIFKSKESFVSGFLSKDWEMKPSSTQNKPSFLSVDGDETETPLKATNNPNTTKTSAAIGATPTLKDGNYTIQKSQDWLTFNTLGQHVEIPYSMGIFSSTVSSTKQKEASPSLASSPSIRTDFSSPSMSHIQKKSAVKLPTASNEAPVVHGTKKKKKRKRAPRKKQLPLNKRYTDTTENDVLMGRGGKSNHHPGNARYRAEVERLQESYKKTDGKDEKTRISETLVTYVQSYGGHFLEKDEDGWYIIEDVVARRKVSQALREDKDPEKRREKRERFLAKKSRLEEEARRKEMETKK